MQVLRANPAGGDQPRGVLKAPHVALQQRIVDEEAAIGGRGVGESVLVLDLEGAVGLAEVIGDEDQIALHRLADAGQLAEVAVDGEGLQVDGVGPQLLPVLSPFHRVHLGVDANLDLEVRVALLDDLQQVGQHDGDCVHLDLAQPIQQLVESPLKGPGPLLVAQAGRVQEVVELHALSVDGGNVAGQGLAAHRGGHVGGAPAADHIGGEFAIDLEHGVLRQVRQQIEIIVGRKHESHVYSEFSIDGLRVGWP